MPPVSLLLRSNHQRNGENLKAILDSRLFQLNWRRLIQTTEKEQKEDLLGDRVNVGNNLPALWKKDGKYVGEDTSQTVQRNQLDSRGW
jgi:hypothetical protein